MNQFQERFIKKAFEIHFDTNESDRKFILLERRFDVILHHFQVQLKFVILKPFKDQKSADIVTKQLANLSKVIGTKVQPVYTSKKIGNDLTVSEAKPPLVNKQNVVYKFQCDLCDADYIGYTSRHLHQRIDEHRHSAIGKHVKGVHNEDAERIVNCFSVLRKCQGKYDCLLYEMLYIKEHKPSLNTQSDSIQAEVFV